MSRYFMHMAYDGTAYHGWQVQPNASTVQATLEKAVSTLLGQETAITGAGRTDTGVHASCFVAHFDHTPPADSPTSHPTSRTSKLHPESPEFLFKLNRFLPPDIVIYNIRQVDDELHARFSATYRTYRYHISSRKPLYRRNYALYHFGKPDLEEIERCCRIILESNDFTSFSKLHTDVKTNNCRVSHAKWSTSPQGYVFEITADRFLRNMVRSLMGTLMDAGAGKIDARAFRAILEARDRTQAGQSAPAHGLFLVDIGYPGYELSPSTGSWP